MLSNTTDSSYYSSLFTSSTAKTSGIIKGEGTETAASAATTAATLGKDDFLKLLLAELQNQDPLNPADNTEFVAQLAQFSTLEQITQMNENLESTMTANSSTAQAVNNAMAVGYFGKVVEAETSEFAYDGVGEQTIRFALEEAAFSGTLKITDESGNVIRSIDLDPMEAGEQSVVWDGATNGGAAVASGTYSFTVEAKDPAGAAVEWKPLYVGIVDSIVFRDGKSYVSLGGVLVTVDKMLAVTEY